jgi:hypothetical protein
MSKPNTYEAVRVSRPSPPAPPARTARRAGVLCAVAALTLVIGCAMTQWQFAVSTVPDDAWRFPWSPAAFIVTTLIWATTQAAIVPALLAWQRSGAAGVGSAARWGLRLVVIGSVTGVVAHLASLPFVDARLEDLAALAAVFGIGALLATVGFLMAGVTTVRTGHWTGLFRWTPLGIGIVGVSLMFLQFTPLLPTGVGLYYLGFLPLGLAVARTAHTETSA